MTNDKLTHELAAGTIATTCESVALDCLRSGGSLESAWSDVAAIATKMKEIHSFRRYLREDAAKKDAQPEVIDT